MGGYAEQRLARITGGRAAETKLVLRDGILQFTTPEDARGKPVLRIHVLADLTMRIRNFPGPDIHLHPSGVEFEDEEESDVESAFDDPEEIVSWVRGVIDDERVEVSLSNPPAKIPNSSPPDTPHPT